MSWSKPLPMTMPSSPATTSTELEINIDLANPAFNGLMDCLTAQVAERHPSNGPPVPPPRGVMVTSEITLTNEDGNWSAILQSMSPPKVVRQREASSSTNHPDRKSVV